MSDHHRARATADEKHAGMRIDRFVADEINLFSRSQLRHHGAVLYLNGEIVKPSRIIRRGDLISVSYQDTPEPSVAPEAIDLDIMYEDSDVVVVNKSQGLVVHPAPGNWSGTLAQGLMHHIRGLSAESDSLRPGIVHRLDKETSGVLIAAKSPEAKEYLSRQFYNRSVVKSYIAIVRGTPPLSKGEISIGIARDPRNRKRFATIATGGKSALTEYRVLQRFAGYAYLAIHPLTGRTHQIRVHTRHIGCPIVGDPLYGKRDQLFPDVRLMLHASSLTIRLPGSGTDHTFTAPQPERFRGVLKALGDLRLASSVVQRKR